MIFKEDNILVVGASYSDEVYFVIREKGPDAIITIKHGHWYLSKGVLSPTEEKFIEQHLIKIQREYAKGNPIRRDSEGDSV